MRIWVALVVAAGCSRPAPPPPPAYLTPPAKLVEPLPTVQRPPFSLTFLLAGLPPPLTRAPSLAPTLQVPPYWPAVCDRRGWLSEEVLDYVLAWCSSRTGKLEPLADYLMRLRHGYHGLLTEAAAEDLANLVVDDVPVQLDPRIADYLVAIHVFHDDLSSALELLDRGRKPWSPPEDCDRTVLRLLVQFDRATVERLVAFAGTRCLRDAELLECAAERVRLPPSPEQDSLHGVCGGREMTDADIQRVRLAEAYWRWRSDEPATWNAVVTAAMDTMTDVPGSEELAVSILEAESAAVCKPAMHDDARALARLVSMAPGHDARFDDRITRVVGHVPSCVSER